MTQPPNHIHPAAANGYTVTVDRYVKGRPDYPLEIAEWLHNQLGLHPELTVVDLGAGTGKFTSRLIDTGAAVIAVEPVQPMLDRLSLLFPTVKTLTGTAEAIPLPDVSMDVVVCAQSFHWFATPEALTEIHRILKPGGKLGLVWNMRDNRVDWVKRLNQIVNEFEGDAPRYHTGAWRKAFPFPGFGTLHEQHFSHTHTGAPDDVILNRIKSTSFIAALPAEKQKHIETQVRALIENESELHNREIVTVPYETAAFYTIKD